MPEEKDLLLKETVNDTDKIRVVTSAGLSQSIEVGHLKSSLFIDDLPGRVGILESRADVQEANDIDLSSEIVGLKLTVGEEEVSGETVTRSGLFERINNVRSDLSTLHLEEVSRLDGELSDIRGRLILIDHETEGGLVTLTQKQSNLESAVDDLESAVDAGFKVISQIPASASATGQPGQVCWDTTYFYVCVGTNTWRRTPLESW